MTTRLKLNLASLTASTLIFLNVFSHILGIPESAQWGLIVFVWIPLGLVFYYIKKLKAENAAAVGNSTLPAENIANKQMKGRRRLIIIWACMFPFTMSCPFWLPIVSGVSLGRRGDYATALGAFLMLSVIFWIGIRKMPNHLSDQTSASGTSPAGQEPRLR